jgi:formylglycine-generating enzyme required for sulfatase activity
MPFHGPSPSECGCKTDRAKKDRCKLLSDSSARGRPPYLSASPEASAYTVADGEGQTAHAHAHARIWNAASQATPTQMPPKAFRVCLDCPEMAIAPGGAFLMSSPPVEVGRFDDEGPRHGVQVNTFVAGNIEVTWHEYDRFVLARACSPPEVDGLGKGEWSLTNQSWDDAKNYAYS